MDAVIRVTFCLGVLLGAAFGQDLEPKEEDRSPRAARLRRQALEVWEKAAPAVETLGLRKTLPAEEAVAATRTTGWSIRYIR